MTPNTGIEALEEIAEQTDVHGNTKSPRGCKNSRTARPVIPPKMRRLFGRAKGRKQNVTLPPDSLEQSNG